MKTELEVLTDIIMHISEVKENLSQIVSVLERRGIAHDRTKFLPVEFDAFVETRPKFKVANYGSIEYQECVDMIKPSIEHHYSNNRHHTKYHKNGFADMSFIDILEMIADWKAANRRSTSLTFEKSLPMAYKKYGIPLNMQKHIEATMVELGWIDGNDKS